MVDFIRNRNFWIILLSDAFLILAAFYLSFLIRFDFRIPAPYMSSLLLSVGWIVPVKLVTFFIFNLYRGMYRYTSIHDFTNLAKAILTSSCFIVLLFLYFLGYEGFSRGIFIIDMMMSFVMIGGFRISIRLFMSTKGLGMIHRRDDTQKTKLVRIFIIGAGDAGEKLLRELIGTPQLPFKVIGFIDENPGKIHRKIHGVPVLGTPQELQTLATKHDINELVIAVPSASAKQMRRLVSFCKSTGLPYKTLPGLSELIQGDLVLSSLREVQYSDLLGRPAVDMDINQVGRFLEAKIVMVTGAGGSIGSELCRQIARFNPRRLLLLERNESGLYDIEFDLRSKYSQLKTESILCAIQNRERMQAVFKKHQPQVVFHAAAYKHVPMMEAHPWEAIYNNILGSRCILEQCHANNIERCVVVSTDKAVRPTNIMGATKRVVEIIAQCMSAKSKTKFMAVRFGNVLGSAGSVLPLFKRQIEAGGPVTVTHPEVTRYFMTIPESCSLILQASALGDGGELFVLKMGTPIRIDDMARDLISLSGLEPETDIPIVYTGLRPGEKLYEELITKDEGILPTRHEDIMVLGANKFLSQQALDEGISKLTKLAASEDRAGIMQALKDLVSEYQPQKDGSESSPKSKTVRANSGVPV